MRVLSYGEALVDFLPDRAGVPLRDVETFSRAVGGAPANAAVGLARLGCDVALLGKVGADEFGHFLCAELAREGVDVAGVTQTREAKTGITFISLDAEGDRSFLFFREPSADMTMRRNDIDTDVIDGADIVVAGSNLLTAAAVRDATMFVLEHARASGRFIVLDPNIRPHLWPNPEEMIPTIRAELALADIVKLNEEELAMFAPDGDTLWSELRESGARGLIITRASDGARLYRGGGVVEVDAPSAEVKDTTGAGDGFVAGLVCGLIRASEAGDAATLRTRVDDFDDVVWHRVLGLGCHVGTTVCTRLGATGALPHAVDIPWEELEL